MKRLDEILTAMQCLHRDKQSDYELSHGNADDLLVEVVRNLATPETNAVVTDIIAAYDAVGKWYS